MIPKFQMTALRNAEHFQFISSASELFARFKVDTDNLDCLMKLHIQTIEATAI